MSGWVGALVHSIVLPLAVLNLWVQGLCLDLKGSYSPFNFKPQFAYPGALSSTCEPVSVCILDDMHPLGQD